MARKLALIHQKRELEALHEQIALLEAKLELAENYIPMSNWKYYQNKQETLGIYHHVSRT